MKPRMTPPQTDQSLMEPVDLPAERGEIRWRRRKCGTNGVVTSGAVFFDAAERPFVAGVDRWRSAARQKNN